MKDYEHLTFQHEIFGLCFLKKTEEVSDEKKQYYGIYSQQKIFLGWTGFFIEKNAEPEIFVYIPLPFQDKKLETDVIDLIIHIAFKMTNFEKIIAGASFASDNLLKELLKFGFLKNSENFYVLTRKDRSLYELVQIVLEEKNNLLPKTDDMVKDLTERSSRLWYTYFSKGVYLSTGGVARSLITMKDLEKEPVLQTFNMYLENRVAVLTQDAMKKFLMEENVICSENDLNNLSVAFSLGSHEGLMRAVRCIYRAGVRDGVFFPQGSYGLLAVAMLDLKPFGYTASLVKVSWEQGEKISLNYLQKLVVKFPTKKLLFIDLKTTVGAVYKEEELRDIILFCKQHNLFLILDAAHINMEFDRKNRFPNVVLLCQKLNYYHFIVMYTGSKTYGLERGRVGFILLDKRNELLTLQQMEDDFQGVFGTVSDLPIEVACKLLQTPLAVRQHYLAERARIHRFNMNLMIAYIEGINSLKLDSDLREEVINLIPPAYHEGIKGFQLIYKPESGIQLKVDMSCLQTKWYLNFRMFNAEIFLYVLNKMAGIVALHAYQIMDPRGFSLRLSFSIRKDIHRGMQAIHDFVGSLTDVPCKNRFLPDVSSAESLIFPMQQRARARGTFFGKNEEHQDLCERVSVLSAASTSIRSML